MTVVQGRELELAPGSMVFRQGPDKGTITINMPKYESTEAIITSRSPNVPTKKRLFLREPAHISRHHNDDDDD